MRLLILGGTAWLGRALAAAGARLVTMDRTEADAYAQVVTGQSDTVVEVSRQPGQVRSAARALRGADDHGQAKVACEAHVLDAFGPSRCEVVRLMDVSHAAALSAQLVQRPLAHTLDWELGRSPDPVRRAGSTQDDQARLLRGWQVSGQRSVAARRPVHQRSGAA